MNAIPISHEAIHQARQQAAQTGSSFVNVLAETQQREPHTFIDEVAQLALTKRLAMTDLHAMHPTFQIISLDQAIKRQCLLLKNDQHKLCLIVHDPFDRDLIEFIRSKSDEPVVVYLALYADILAFLSQQEERARTVNEIKPQTTPSKNNKDYVELSYSTIANESNAAVRFVNSTLYDALKTNVSDVHFETVPSGLNLKYRIDGVLNQIARADSIELAEQIISRIKVLSELDIAERRIPQDGSFTVQIAEHNIDLRVSVMPSVHGEDIVIRILDKRTMIEEYGALSLATLGFDKDTLESVRQLTDKAHGMLLVTGPTGSGKTTSLYAALTEISTEKEKIITIEDPVEYQLPGILQIPVNEKKGLSFATGLRSILRHDPDIIMVGEIRDKDTAEIAVQSALTGHLVFTTVHANSVYDVFGRFAHMGVDLYAFASSLNGIIAQRLIRKNCPHCVKPYQPSNQELRKSRLSEEVVSHFHFSKGTGCGDCRGTGFKGRKAIGEILILNDEIRELILEKKSVRHLKEAATRNGTVSLRDAALEMVRKGETSLEEARKVIAHD